MVILEYVFEIPKIRGLNELYHYVDANMVISFSCNIVYIINLD